LACVRMTAGAAIVSAWAIGAVVFDADVPPAEASAFIQGLRARSDMAEHRDIVVAWQVSL
jgi:hypothetical protein